MLDSTSEQTAEPLLVYGCTHWRASSQLAADLYRSEVKFWRKEDLLDIERQLAQSQIKEKFAIRRIDGSIINIKNPMFGVLKPIWRPFVQFQEYWGLVRSTPDANRAPELYSCTYFVDWSNESKIDFDGPIENASSLFQACRKQWNASATCETFTSLFREILDTDTDTKVTKIVCFGLGDLHSKPPDWWKIENERLPKEEQRAEASENEGPMIQHAIALTMADIARSYAKAGNARLRLLTQDPKYSNETKEMLQNIGFEIVGDHGAGGFAEIDDASIVFSAYPGAPVKQIIADIARPVVIISHIDSKVLNTLSKPYSDPESPRTRQMWKEYKSWGFLHSHENVKLEGSLHRLEIFARTSK